MYLRKKKIAIQEREKSGENRYMHACMHAATPTTTTITCCPALAVDYYVHVE